MSFSVSPLYTIHGYTESMYKVVCFKGNRDPDKVFLRDHEEQQHYENKLDSNFSRARSMVLQYALCNPWDYFFTGTLDRSKYNRYDLDSFAAALSQFVRDKRKKYDAKFQYLFVPEQHKDGAWHMHGLIQGLPVSVLSRFSPPAPLDLISGGFLNWPDYQDKFGFCSLAPIRDPVATAYYITKYVSKDLARRGGDLGKHLYFHSRPLRKAEKLSEVYLYQSELEQYCTHDHDFCKTGMVEDAPWYFPYQWDGSEAVAEDPLFPKPLEDPLQDFDPMTVDPFYEQLRFSLS